MCDLLLTSLLRLARFYTDAQELLFSDPEFLQLDRLWRELNAMSNFMDTLRTHPEKVSGQCSRLSETYVEANPTSARVFLLVVSLEQM